MIPNDIEMIVMTKKDYDRNVEQLLLDKLKLEDRIDKAIEYIKENACYGIQEKCCLDDLNYNECDELLEILGDKE